MAYGISTVHLIGHLGHPPSVKDVNGAKVAEVSLAVNHGRKGDERTDWYRLSLWRGLADIAEQYLDKGALIYAEGELALRTYTGRDGKERTSAEVTVTRMKMLGSQDGQDRSERPETARQGATAAQDVSPLPQRDNGAAGPSEAPSDAAADDLPF